jgi:hypothetical protein
MIINFQYPAACLVCRTCDWLTDFAFSYFTNLRDIAHPRGGDILKKIFWI